MFNKQYPFYSLLKKKAAAQLLLDKYGNAQAGFSLRKLSSTYNGSAIRVRRASDNTQQDIGFSGNNLDTSSLSTFCSGTNCFITVWYNQAGNEKHARQTNTSRQPKIYDATNGLITTNGKPAMNFNGSSMTLTVSTFSTPAIFTYLQVGSYSTSFTSFETTSSNSHYAYSLTGATLKVVRNNLGIEASPASGWAGTTQACLTWMVAGTQATSGTSQTGAFRIYRNIATQSVSYGASSYIGNNDVITNPLYIGSRAEGSLFLNGNLQEAIHFNESKVADITNIVNEINTYWSLY